MLVDPSSELACPTRDVDELSDARDRGVSDAPRARVSDAPPAAVSDEEISDATTAWDDRFAIHAGAGFIKVPRELIGDVAENGVPSHVDLEDAIIAGFILRHHELRGYSPTLRQLQDLAGRGRNRVLASVNRLSMRGVIRAHKAPFPMADGTQGWRWRFRLPDDSPLRGLMGAAADGPAARAWIKLPADIARKRSLHAAATRIVLQELAIREGVAVISCTALAALLRCHPDTASRSIKACGGVPIERTAHGTVYAIGTGVTPRSSGGYLTLAGVGCKLPSHELDRTRVKQRLERVLEELRKANVDVDAELERAVQSLMRAGGGIASVIGVARVLEERHLSVVIAAEETRGFIARALSWRLRVKHQGTRSYKVRVPRRERRMARMALPVLQSAPPVCAGGCHEGWVFVRDDEGRELAAPCPECRPALE